ncbi:hypothetical protein V1503_19330 [Bacillus sp. SCS-151]
MKASTAYAMSWIATVLAVSVGIIITKSAIPLWALIIPLFIRGEFSSEG